MSENISKIELKMDFVKNLFDEKKYDEAIIESEKLLEKHKNREVRRYIYNILGQSYLALEVNDFAELNLRKAYPKLTDKEFYLYLAQCYKARENNQQSIKYLELLLEKYPDDVEIHNEMVDLALRENYDMKAMYHLASTENWSYISASCRSTLFWDKLYEIDNLVLDDVRNNRINNQIILTFMAMFIDTITAQDLYNINNRVITNELQSLKLLDVRPLVEGFERKIPRKRGKKLKIGYLSSDFYGHATMLLLMRVLELHDLDNFEVHLFITNNIDKKIKDSYIDRIKALNVTQHKLFKKSEEEIAEVIKDAEIDILVDLKGYTNKTATYCSIYRPAPIIVSWLGYPNTLGIERLADYIITDKIVSPEDQAPYFSETFAYMPHSYQPNDNSIEYSTPMKRSDYFLPEDAVIFCSFNGIKKLNPRELDYWCALLNNIPNTVLWILMPKIKLVKENLLKEINKRGIDSERVIFAQNVSFEEHRNRLSLADIALDSFPCTSHTTASDLMVAGVPLIAQIGNTFASRVSASVVTANGCPELVARNIKEAYNLAYSLATNKELLQAVKAQIKANIKTEPLYNSELFTKNLERLYNKMWEQYENGKKEIITLD